MKNSALIFVLVCGLFSANLAYSDNSDAAFSVTESVVLFVDINNDGAEKMADLLSGIGEKKAAMIVAYREENGPFNSVEDLMDVPGIGLATLNKNRAAIRLNQ